MLTVVADPSAEEYFLIPINQKGGIVNTKNTPSWPQVCMLQSFKLLAMQLSLQSQLTCLVTAHHKHISIAVYSHRMTPSACDRADVADGLLVGLGLLVKGGVFMGYSAPGVN